MAFADQVQPQRFNERAFAHARHATNAQAQGAACVGQQGRQLFIALRTVVGAGGFEQRDGLGHCAALRGSLTVQDTVFQIESTARHHVRFDVGRRIAGGKSCSYNS